jgi:excisionase family DNA binding protein
MTARLRSIGEAAQELGVSKDHVRRLISRSALRAVRLGKRLLIPQGEIDRLVTNGCGNELSLSGGKWTSRRNEIRKP